MKKSIDAQARYFLERYMDEFTGRWEEVLDQVFFFVLEKKNFEGKKVLILFVSAGSRVSQVRY